MTNVNYIDILIVVSTVWAVAAVTPGPNFFITVHSAVSGTRKMSLLTTAGIVVGTLMWALSGLLGVSIVFKTVPFLYCTLKVIGGVYLVIVGLRLISPTKSRMRQKGKPMPTPLQSFKLGLYTNLSNPKTAAFMTSLFAATIPSHAPIGLGLLCIVTICSVSAIWYSCVAILISFQGPRNIYDKFKRAIERVAGTIFILFGARLALSK